MPNKPPFISRIIKAPEDFSSIAGARGKDNAYFACEELEEFTPQAAELRGWKTAQEDAMLLASAHIDQPQNFFINLFNQFNDQIKTYKPGSTASMYYFNPQTSQITTANLGDSRVYLTIKTQDDSEEEEDNKKVARYVTFLLTEDHNLEVERIKNHIEANNGTILFGRVDLTLNMGGAIGDMEIPSLLKSPDLATFQIDQLLQLAGIQTTNYEIILTTACDGLTNKKRDYNHEFSVKFREDQKFFEWVDEKTNDNYQKTLEQQATLSKLIEKYDQDLLEDKGELANFLANNANQNVQGDNISVCTVRLKSDKLCVGSPPFVSAVFDGHGGDSVSKKCLNIMKLELEKIKENQNNTPSPIISAPYEAIKKYISSNHDSQDENLKNFKLAIKKNSNEPCPQSAYRGIGIKLVKNGDDFIIDQVFSPDILRFKNIGQEDYLEKNDSLINKKITHIYLNGEKPR